jgi:hypothetical protein
LSHSDSRHRSGTGLPLSSSGQGRYSTGWHIVAAAAIIRLAPLSPAVVGSSSAVAAAVSDLLCAEERSEEHTQKWNSIALLNYPDTSVHRTWHRSERPVRQALATSLGLRRETCKSHKQTDNHYRCRSSLFPCRCLFSTISSYNCSSYLPPSSAGTTLAICRSSAR